MKKPAVRFEDVYKEFPLYYHITGGIKNFLFRLPEAISSLRKTRFVALKGVSFEVRKGEALGIVGVNGSGKSTILSLIAGVLRPDRGRVSVNGKVSSLLELGAGFHPELSGMENIMLNGNLLGLTKRQVLERMDEIVEFSGLGDFIYQPIRTYSSGMYMRLGFSVAAHLEHEILLVDEVIAVGDAEFQEKCFRKMQEIRSSGVTIIIVSHDMPLIKGACDRALWIDEGAVKSSGEPETVVSDYLSHIGHPPLIVSRFNEQPEELKQSAGVSGFDSLDDSIPILEHIGRLIAVDSRDFYDLLKEDYGGSGLQEGLCIRSRFKGIEEIFAATGICKSFDVVEAGDIVDAGCLSGIGRGEKFDMLLSVDVLGRTKNIGEFLATVRNFLKEDALIVFFEYVGPPSATTRQKEIFDGLYRVLPESCKNTSGDMDWSLYNHGDGRAVAPAIGSFFDISLLRHIGGSLYGPLLSGSINLGALQRQSPALIKMLLELEQVLIKNNILADDYALIIARNRA